ncbi:MAG: PHB depolymerase family esterase, partial [Pseudomonadota bacterium]|nr:PHB depolymerase family esterase [Pseudomonadota bacterium]
RFLVHDFAGPEPAPLVILLHGGGGNGENMVMQTGFDTVAEREGLIAVYPYGSSALFDNALLTWNAGHCCSYAMRENVDDVRFISLLIDTLVATGRVDPERVYVTGLSNGGMLTHRLGRELPHKIAAIAPVISSLFGDEPVQSLAMPTLIINGADDRIVKPEGGELGVSVGGGLIGGRAADRPALPITRQGEYWAAVNGCSSHTDTASSVWTLRSYESCIGGAVQSYAVEDNGHAWPGGTAPRPDADQPTQAVDANELIWDFFRQQHRSSHSRPELLPYYYDGELTIPAFATNDGIYSARLLVRAGDPLQFDVLQLQDAEPSSVPGPNEYRDGQLVLPRVAVGTVQYHATLILTSLQPLRLQLVTLLPAE